MVGGAILGGLAGGEVEPADGAGADNLPPHIPEWMKVPGAAMGRPVTPSTVLTIASPLIRARQLRRPSCSSSSSFWHCRSEPSHL
jgi:hypothetical protein